MSRWFAWAGLALGLTATIAAAATPPAVLAPSVDLTVSLTSASDEGGPVRVGQSITYTLAVSNLGPGSADDVAVRVVLPIVPDGTSIFLPHEQGSFTCRVSEEAGSAAALTCTGGTIPGTGSAVIRFQATFDEDPVDMLLGVVSEDGYLPGPVITARAMVDPEDAISESDETNNVTTEELALTPRRAAR